MSGSDALPQPSGPVPRSPLPAPEGGAPSRRAEAEVHPAFLSRWSPRSFAPDPVAPEDLRSLFEAARWAPSSNNTQPWLFLYAQGPEGRARFLEGLHPRNRAWASRAPVLAYLLARTHLPGPPGSGPVPNPFARFDAGAAWMALALQAHFLGLSTHAIGGLRRPEVYSVLGVSPQDYDVIVGIAIGRSGEPTALPGELAAREHPSARKPLSAILHEGALGPPRAG